jgi:NADPH:quinone reductase-like Zn-dependent oxidoreductase
VAIRWQGRLEAGETLLVLGAAGGVGLTAVEIGRAMGARVIAGASTAEKLAVAREHGADDGINYTTENLTERVMARTGDQGADVCFDPIGGELADAALSSLGWGGRMLWSASWAACGSRRTGCWSKLLGLSCSLRRCNAHRTSSAPRRPLGWYAAGKLTPT